MRAVINDVFLLWKKSALLLLNISCDAPFIVQNYYYKSSKNHLCFDGLDSKIIN